MAAVATAAVATAMAAVARATAAEVTAMAAGATARWRVHSRVCSLDGRRAQRMAQWLAQAFEAVEMAAVARVMAAVARATAAVATAMAAVARATAVEVTAMAAGATARWRVHSRVCSSDGRRAQRMAQWLAPAFEAVE